MNTSLYVSNWNYFNFLMIRLSREKAHVGCLPLLFYCSVVDPKFCV
uniref:Uncharacterized protein n=1 Tax=Anguilla anguilla TaxID=7936 RepID=A0A0E9VIU0_ANGAN